MSKRVRPHGGGDLRPLLLDGDLLASEKSRAMGLPKIVVISRSTSLTPA